MPFVKVEWLEGRTHEQKQIVAKEITETISRTIGLDPKFIWVVFHDVPKEEWALGGTLLSELATLP